MSAKGAGGSGGLYTLRTRCGVLPQCHTMTANGKNMALVFHMFSGSGASEVRRSMRRSRAEVRLRSLSSENYL